MNHRHHSTRQTVALAAACRIAAACALGGLAVSPLATQAASLSAFAGVVTGASGNIAGGCTTSGPPPELAFFGGFAPGLQVLGGNTACGFSGGWTNPTATGTTTPLTNSARLPPTPFYAATPSAPVSPQLFEGTADSRASYGSLSAKASGRYSGTAAYASATAVGVGAATFSDTLSATVPKAYTDVSTSGFVRYRFSLDGSMSAPGPQRPYFGGTAQTAFNIQQDDGPILGLLNMTASTATLGDVRGAGAGAGWTFGSGTVSGGNTFESGLFAIDLLKSWNFKAGLIVSAYGWADNDFYSTAKLVGLDLFDAQGHAIDGFSLSSASGVNYLAAAVPEPATTALLVMGLLGLAGFSHARRAPWTLPWRSSTATAPTARTGGTR